MAEYLMIAAVRAEPLNEGCTDWVTVEPGEEAQVRFAASATWFEDNAVEIEPGTGPALKAVAATALLIGIREMNAPVPFVANDEPSNAEQGKFTDDMVTAVARIAYNVVREWRKYEGLLHHPPFDEATDNQHNMARTRVRNIAENKRYPLDIANKASVFEDQLYRVVTAAVLAD